MITEMPIMTKPSLLSAASLLLATTLACTLAGCGPTEDAEGAESRGAMMTETIAPPEVTCSAEYNDDLVRDKRLAEQSFELVVEPGAAANFDLGTLQETFTLTAKAEADGKERKFTSSPKALTRNAVIANKGKTAEKYEIKIKRSGTAKTEFRVLCYPITLTSDEPSGVTDHRLCLAGKRCTKSTAKGPETKTCDGEAMANVGASTAGGIGVGWCI